MIIFDKVISKTDNVANLPRDSAVLLKWFQNNKTNSKLNNYLLFTLRFKPKRIFEAYFEL